MNWNTAGPRVSAVFDVTGDGKTAAKAVGRPLLLRDADRRRRRDASTRTRNYSEQYTWNDANGDRKFQPGEQTGTPVVTPGVGATTISIDPNFRGRTPTNTGPASTAS